MFNINIKQKNNIPTKRENKSEMYNNQKKMFW